MKEHTVTPAPQRRHRVVFVIKALAGRSGGAERVLVDVANALAARHCDVEIWHYELRRGAPFYPVDPRICVYNIHPMAQSDAPKKPAEPGGMDRIAEFLKPVRFVFPLSIFTWLREHKEYIRWLRRFIKASKADAVIAFMPSSFTNAIIAGLGTGVPVVASVHNVPEADFENPKRWDPNPLDRFLRKFCLRFAAGITVLLDNFVDWYPKGLHRKIRVIGNMVDVPPGRANPGKLNAEDNTIIAVGRMAPAKDHPTLVRAFALIANRHPNWAVKIFGEGPGLKELQAVIAETQMEGRVRLMGVTDKVFEEYQKSKIFCIPSLFEGFGLVTAEALGKGLPAVGFADCPGTNMLIRHDVNGLLVDPSDRVHNLAAALERLMLDDELRARLGETGPASVAKYSPQSIGDIWYEMVDEIARKGRLEQATPSSSRASAGGVAIQET